MTSGNDRPHFEVHPSVVFQLGESLISDAVQALIELVKNCYDADASYAKVTIDTRGDLDCPGAIFPADGGRIVVEDDGNGMDADTIRSGWLLISSRTKWQLKQERKTTPGGRTPLGDKGLGRLGVQRLGEDLDVFTRTGSGPAYHFGFSWLDFATAPSLQDVDIHFAQTQVRRSKGTMVVVSNLREIDLWRGQESVKKLEHELSQMISPYRSIRDFTVALEVDGKPLELLEISDKVRDLAPIRYSLSFDGTRFLVHGRARLDFFRPERKEDAAEFALLAESDGGERFLQSMLAEKRAQYLKVGRATGSRWYVEFSFSKHFEDLDRPELDQASCGPANPGAFRGEIDSFDLGPAAFRGQSVFDRIQEYRSHIKSLSGVRVYRDGFGIRVDRDWLKLGAQWTSASSYYGLKPDTTLGYIALSARDNMRLEETTDREGFKDSPYYRNFYSLLMEFKRFSTDVHEFFGRSWVAFQKARREQLAKVDTRESVEAIAQNIKAAMSGASEQQKAVASLTTRFNVALTNSRKVAQNLSGAGQLTPALHRRALESFASLNSVIEDATHILERVNAYLARLEGMQELGHVLNDRVESVRRQVDDMYETVALGLTAEAVSHEVFRIADELASRTKRAEATARSSTVPRAVVAYLEHVHGAVQGLRKQVSFLSPALRYVREQREDLSMREFLVELEGFYRDRLAKSSIRIRVRSDQEAPMLIRMNRGKLTQVFGNLVLNSEYWLKREITAGRMASGEIDFETAPPFVRVWDDGRGIDPSVEVALFEPFISAKARGEGRGLGLFIVKQLLDSESCRIGVVPERNRFGRLFKFQIDLRGAIRD